MAYYYFNNCPEGKVKELARFFQESGMLEVVADDPKREWQGNKVREIWKIEYDPNLQKGPLLFQTHSGIDYQNPNILRIMNRIISISGTTQIYDGYDCRRILSMDQFRGESGGQRR